MVDFYGRYIHDLSTKTEPLTRLLQKNTPFTWRKEQESAFQALKDALKKDVTLTMFDTQKQVTLMCDASPVGVGAVIQQDDRLVIFVSKTLSSAERRYSQLEREGLAIVWSIKRLHKYLFGRKFILLTDNKPIS